MIAAYKFIGATLSSCSAIEAGRIFVFSHSLLTCFIAIITRAQFIILLFSSSKVIASEIELFLLVIVVRDSIRTDCYNL